jgi:hypothetical protein
MSHFIGGNIMARTTLLLTLSCFMALPAAADPDGADRASEEAEVGDLDNTFDPDEKPKAPGLKLPNPSEDTVTYAGVGSNFAYSERGTGEFGGSFSFSATSDATQVSADPMVGYFLYDNLQLSGIIGVRHLNVEGASSNRFSVMAEPSLHLPINDGLFWVGGFGAGVAMADSVGPDGALDAGLALAPRTGLQFLIGRSGLLNVGARFSTVLSDLDAEAEPLDGAAVLAFTNAFDVQAGYTVMF